MPPMYEKTPELVEARQLDNDNGEELAEWCGGMLVQEINPVDRELTSPGINVPTDEGNVRASYTDYILKFWNGTFAVRKSQDFQNEFRTARG